MFNSNCFIELFMSKYTDFSEIMCSYSFEKKECLTLNYQTPFLP